MKRGSRYTPEMQKKAFFVGLIIEIFFLVGGIVAIIWGNVLDSNFMMVMGVLVIVCAIILLISNIYDYIKGRR